MHGVEFERFLCLYVDITHVLARFARAARALRARNGAFCAAGPSGASIVTVFIPAEPCPDIGTPCPDIGTPCADIGTTPEKLIRRRLDMPNYVLMILAPCGVGFGAL